MSLIPALLGPESPWSLGHLPTGKRGHAPVWVPLGMLLRGRRTWKHFTCLVMVMKLVSSSTQGEPGLGWSLTLWLFLHQPPFCRDAVGMGCPQCMVLLVSHVPAARKEHEQASRVQASVNTPLTGFIPLEGRDLNPYRGRRRDSHV